MRKIISLRIFQLIIVIIISLSAGFILGTNNINWSWKNYKPIVSIQSKNPPPAQTIDMRLFYEVFDRINQDYYDKTQKKRYEYNIFNCYSINVFIIFF